MSDLSLKDVMRTFPQGVTVVTAKGDDGPRGISFLSCIMKDSSAHDAIEKGRFVVNVLAEDQGGVSDHFASSKLSSDEQCNGYGFPKLDGCLGYPHCKVVDQTSPGTHTVFLGAVDQIELGANTDSALKPLVFCSRQYWGLGETVHER